MSVNEMLMAAAGAGGPSEYVEDVFSTWLYTGNGSTQTITNGIDLAGEGGLVWIKNRTASVGHALFDTIRGDNTFLLSNTTAGNSSNGQTLTGFTSSGFSLGSDPGSFVNGSFNYVSWTFREQPKFFDVVTYTGNGSTQNISHNLGSVPGMIWVKRTDTSSNWVCYHSSLPSGYILYPNDIAAQDNFGTIPQGTFGNNSTPVAPTSTVFTIGSQATVNASGGTYVAYLFAHDAGGFGDAGTDNIISCGSYTGNGTTGNTVTLGYEPQYILIKRTDTAAVWILQDVMRGMSNTDLEYLQAQSSAAGVNDGVGYVIPTATGFTLNSNAAWNASGGTYIYMAIRRPMKTPTSGTQVFSPTYVSAVVTGTKSTTNFPIDLQILSYATGTTENQTFVDRLRGVSTNATESGSYLISSSTAAEATSPAETRFWDNTGFQQHSYFSGGAARYWNFRRATGFFDVVCYTGTGSARTVAHNLGVAPELMIVKQRNATNDWIVYSQTLGIANGVFLNLTAASDGLSGTVWNSTAPTSSVFSVGTNSITNASGSTYVAYLFASVAGVSKVGSYTGNGSSQTINCGFSAGARFVLIKRTDSTGDWCVFDTARGIVSGNDPFLQLNSTAAEVTGEDAVDPVSSGFIVNQTTENLNVNAASYIYLAIA